MLKKKLENRTKNNNNIKLYEYYLDYLRKKYYFLLENHQAKA